MKAVIGVYESQEKAISALQELQKAGYPKKDLSVIAKADLANNNVYIPSKDTVEKTEVSLGATAGGILGLLTGIGIFAIPGLGFLYSAGALVGALAGLEGGLITGGILAIFTTLMGVDSAIAHRYVRHLKEGKYLVIAPGAKNHLKLAQEVLGAQGMAVELHQH